jgi:hypothetical protein
VLSGTDEVVGGTDVELSGADELLGGTDALDVGGVDVALGADDVFGGTDALDVGGFDVGGAEELLGGADELLGVPHGPWLRTNWPDHPL